MKKQDLIKALAKKLNISQDSASRNLDALTTIISETLVSGEEVSITNFGRFSVAHRSERNGVNPQTGKSMVIPASKSATFKPGKSLKDAVKNS